MPDDIAVVVGADPADPDDVRRDAAVWSVLPWLTAVLSLASFVTAGTATEQAVVDGSSTEAVAVAAGAVGLALALVAVATRQAATGFMSADALAALVLVAATAPGLLAIVLTDDVAWSVLVVVALGAAGSLLLSVRWLVVTMYVVWLAWLVCLAVADLESFPVMWLTAGVALTAVAVVSVGARRGSLTDLARAEETAALASVRDPLTGLANRRGLSMLGQQMVEAARRQGDAVHCVYIDIDQLAHVNAVEGPEAGDEVIVAVADALRAVTRSTDVVARWGGDEFCIVGPGAGMAPIELERRVRERVMHNPPVPDESWSPRVCAGGAMLAPWDSGTLDTLLGKADQEMYLRRAIRRSGSKRRGGLREGRHRTDA